MVDPVAPVSSERGELLAEVRSHRGVRWLLTVFTVLLTAVIALALLGLLSDLAQQKVKKRADVAPAFLIPLVPAGFLLLTVWAWRQRLRVYSRGVALRGLLGERWLDYEDVETVILTDPKGQFVPESGCAPWRQPSLLDARGRGVSFRGVLNAGFLAQGPVLSAMYRALHLALPLMTERALERLRAGEEVSFGRDVSASWQGLRVRERQLAWTDFYIDFGGKGLHVYVHNRPDVSLELPGTTPNQHLLIWLAQRLPALSAIRAVTEFGNRPQQPTTSAESPVEPVYGFPDHDPALGRLLCGQGRSQRKQWVYLAMLGYFALLGLAQYLLPGVFVPGFAMGFAWLVAGAIAIAVAMPGVNRVGVSSLTFLVVFIGFVTSAMLMHPQHPMTPTQFAAVTLPWIDLVLALVGLMGFLVVRNEGFAIYEHGIRGPRCVVRWEDSRHLTRNANLAMVALQLEGTTGKVWFTGTDVAAQAAAQMVVSRALPVLLQRTWTALGAGQEWRCGPVRLTREGMTNAGLTVPWEAVYSFKPDQGWLWVWVRGIEKPYISLSLGHRDALVLLSLLEAIFRPQPLGEAPGVGRFDLPRDERIQAKRENVARPADEPPADQGQ